MYPGLFLALLRSLLCGFLCGFLSSLCGLLGRRFFSSLLGRSARNLLSGFLSGLLGRFLRSLLSRLSGLLGWLSGLLGPFLRRFCGGRRHSRSGWRGFGRERRGRRSDAGN